MASCDSASAGTRQKLASTARPSSAEAAAWSAASAEDGGACHAPTAVSRGGDKPRRQLVSGNVQCVRGLHIHCYVNQPQVHIVWVLSWLSACYDRRNRIRRENVVARKRCSSRPAWDALPHAHRCTAEGQQQAPQKCGADGIMDGSQRLLVTRRQQLGDQQKADVPASARSASRDACMPQLDASGSLIVKGMGRGLGSLTSSHRLSCGAAPSTAAALPRPPQVTEAQLSGARMSSAGLSHVLHGRSREVV